MSKRKEPSYPIFTIRANVDGTFNWEFWTVNARVLMTEVNVSEKLPELVKRINAIKTFLEPHHFDRKKYHDNEHYLFDQLSDNPFEVIYRSKLYTSFQSVDKAIEAIKRDAPDAPIEIIEKRRL